MRKAGSCWVLMQEISSEAKCSWAASATGMRCTTRYSGTYPMLMFWHCWLFANYKKTVTSNQALESSSRLRLISCPS